MPKPSRMKFYVVYRADAKSWFVTTTEHGVSVSVSGPYPTKKPALDYAKDKAKIVADSGGLSQVLSQEKGKRRWSTEATYPKSSDPRNIRGIAKPPLKAKKKPLKKKK